MRPAPTHVEQDCVTRRQTMSEAQRTVCLAAASSRSHRTVIVLHPNVISSLPDGSLANQQ